jgi:hypothetical protein
MNVSAPCEQKCSSKLHTIWYVPWKIHDLTAVFEVDSHAAQSVCPLYDQTTESNRRHETNTSEDPMTGTVSFL